MMTSSPIPESSTHILDRITLHPIAAKAEKLITKCEVAVAEKLGLLTSVTLSTALIVGVGFKDERPESMTALWERSKIVAKQARGTELLKNELLPLIFDAKEMAQLGDSPLPLDLVQYFAQSRLAEKSTDRGIGAKVVEMFDLSLQKNITNTQTEERARLARTVGFVHGLLMVRNTKGFTSRGLDANTYEFTAKRIALETALTAVGVEAGQGGTVVENLTSILLFAFEENDGDLVKQAHSIETALNEAKRIVGFAKGPSQAEPLKISVPSSYAFAASYAEKAKSKGTN